MRATRRSGFTLPEILLSVVIFSTVILSLTGLSLAIARRATRSLDQTAIMSLLLTDADRLTTLPFDSLSNAAGCVTSAGFNMTVTRCRTVVPVSSVVDSIRIVVRSSVPASRPDTIAFVRGRVRKPVPLR